MRINTEDSKSSVSSMKLPSAFNDFSKSFISDSEYSNINRHNKFMTLGKALKITYVVFTVINSLLGIYITFKSKKIKLGLLLYTYILLYSFFWPIILTLCVISGTVLILTRLVITKQHSKRIHDTTEFSKYCLVIISVLVYALYIVAAPFSLYSFYILSQRNLKLTLITFEIKLFSAVNLIKSFGIILLLLYQVFIKKSEDTPMINIKDDYLKEIEREIEQAKRISGIFVGKSDLIKYNDYFNKHEVPFDSQIKHHASSIRRSPKKAKTSCYISSNDLRIKIKENKEREKNKIKELIKAQTLMEDNKADYIQQLKKVFTIKADNQVEELPISKSPILSKRDRAVSNVYDSCGIDLIKVEEGKSKDDIKIFQPDSTKSQDRRISHQVLSKLISSVSISKEDM